MVLPATPRCTTHESVCLLGVLCVTPPSLRVQLQAASVLQGREFQSARVGLVPCALWPWPCASLCRARASAQGACSRARTPALETVGLGCTGSGSCIGGRGAAHAHCGVLPVQSVLCVECVREVLGACVR